jgi:predicted RNA-binding protein Jag
MDVITYSEPSEENKDNLEPENDSQDQELNVDSDVENVEVTSDSTSAESTEEEQTEESTDVVATEENEDEFQLSDKHKNLIKKYLHKSNKYLKELDDEMNTEIDIETATLDRMIDTPVFKK